MILDQSAVVKVGVGTKSNYHYQKIKFIKNNNKEERTRVEYYYFL